METDIAIIGAGAAGLAAAIFAGETARASGRTVLLLDGARKPGAKILVSGGGRCNVTNERVTPDDFWGGPRPMIRNVLRAFDNRRTLAWMRELGVELKLEPTGKYFPVTDKARTVLDALLRAVERAGVRTRWDARARAVTPTGDGFRIDVRDVADPIHARRVVLATGGLSLPKSGSDGWGLDAARRLGHTVVPTTPALAPLLLRAGQSPGGRFADLSGLTMDVRLGLQLPGGKQLEERTGSLLFTHFGISGPAALDLSRHWLRARMDDPEAGAWVTLGHPDFATVEVAEKWLADQASRHPRRAIATAMGDLYPDRLARMIEPTDATFATLSRGRRRELATAIARMPLDVEGHRGWAFAETTAGGVELREVDVRTMESRRVPGLYLCGEMLDVDGRIGGFNFQWAWASGYLAGRAAGGAA